MPTDIGEHIKAMAVFDIKVRPVKLKRRGRVYPVKEITCMWKGTLGSADVTCVPVGVSGFSVTDGVNLYAVAYNQSTMKWSLEGVEPLQGVEA